MRTANLTMLSGLFVQIAHATDGIRLSTFPNDVLGTWAETKEQCAAKDKSNVVIEPTRYGDGDGSCAVSSVLATSTPTITRISFMAHVSQIGGRAGMN